MPGIDLEKMERARAYAREHVDDHCLTDEELAEALRTAESICGYNYSLALPVVLEHIITRNEMYKNALQYAYKIPPKDRR